MTRVLTTQSGATYEVDGDRIRRVEGADGNTKRADEEWVRLLRPLPSGSLVGYPMILTLEPLAAYGPDDYGNQGGPTFRTTTPVVTDTETP